MVSKGLWWVSIEDVRHHRRVLEERLLLAEKEIEEKMWGKPLLGTGVLCL